MATCSQFEIQNQSILVSWIPPFTHNITDVEPDITYCVDVMINNLPNHKQCMLDDSEFSYSLPPRNWCHDYCFSVTPMNPVGNGKSSLCCFNNNYSGMLKA